MKKFLKRLRSKPSPLRGEPLGKEIDGPMLKEQDPSTSSSSTISHVSVTSGVDQDFDNLNGDVARVLNCFKTGAKHEINQALRLLIDFSHEDNRLFIREGGVQLLLRILRKKRRSQELVLEALVALFDSGVDWRGAFYAGNGTELLVKILLKRWQKSPKRTAVRAVPHLLETHGGKVAFHAAGGIIALIKVLEWGGEKDQTSAAKGLSVLAREDSVYKEEIIARGGMAILQNLCRSGQASVACMNALADLTTGNVSAQSDMATMPRSTITICLLSDVPEMREAAARMLLNASESWKFCSAIEWQYGVRMLLAGLESGRTEPEVFALRALNNFCRDPTGMERVMLGLPVLARIVASGNPACQVEAIRCLTQAMTTRAASVRESCNAATIRGLVGILHWGELEYRCQAVSLLSAMMNRVDSARGQVVDSGGIPPLIQLLASGDDHANETAANALIELSEDERAAGSILSQGGLGPLVVILAEAPSSRKLLVMQCLSNLAQAANFGQVDSEAGTSSQESLSRGDVILLEQLIKLLAGNDNRVVLMAASCLSSVLNGRPHLQKSALSEGILHKLERMLGVKGQQFAAAIVLSKLSHTGECKASFSSIEKLLAIFPTASVEVKHIIADMVNDFVVDQESAERVLDCPTHQHLLQLLWFSGGVVRALTNIAMHSSALRTIMASNSYMSKIVSRLRGVELELGDMADAARCLAVVVDKDVTHQNQANDCAAIHPLVVLLGLPHSKCKAMSALALATLVRENSTNQQAVAKEGAISILVKQLCDEDDECRQEAAHALSNLTFQNQAIQKRLARENPCGPLLKLLKGDSTASKCHAGRIFANLAQSTDPAVIDLRAHCISTLVATLSSGVGECQENAAGCLANLACCEDEQRMIMSAGGIPPLVNLVRSGQASTQKQAARALANISCQDDHLPEIVSEGGIPVLVNLLSSTFPANRQQAAGALANLACNNAQNSRLIVEAGGIPSLLNLLSGQGDACRIQAIRAMCNLACSPETQKALVDGGTFPFLVVLLKEARDEKPELTRKLVRALFSLISNNEETQLTLLKEGMVDLLLDALKHHSHDDQQLESEVRRALLTLACGVDDEGAAHCEIQAGRVQCVASILGVGPSVLEVSGKEVSMCFGERDLFEGIPRHFLCPITHEVMEDPVVAADGHTYERSAITAWFSNHSTSPMTNQILASSQICPNRLVASMIQEFETKRQQQSNSS